MYKNNLSNIIQLILLATMHNSNIDELKFPKKKKKYSLNVKNFHGDLKRIFLLFKFKQTIFTHNNNAQCFHHREKMMFLLI